MNKLNLFARLKSFFKPKTAKVALTKLKSKVIKKTGSSKVDTNRNKRKRRRMAKISRRKWAIERIRYRKNIA